MRKLQILVLCVLIALAFSGCAKTGRIKSIKYSKDISEEKALSAMSTGPKFHTGKRLTYLMAWNNIPVGIIRAESGDMIKYKGRDAYVLTVVTESNKFLSKIYRVEDTYTSYVDARTMTSLRYEANRKEGNYRKHLVVEYDFDKLEAIYTNLTDGSVKRCPIEKEVQDPVSTICYFMTLPITPGEKIALTVNLNEKNYKLFGVIERIEAVKLPALGLFPAFKVRPYAELKEKRVEKGKAWMYFSADEDRYPLYGVVLITFGRVTATLKSVEDI